MWSNKAMQKNKLIYIKASYRIYKTVGSIVEDKVVHQEAAAEWKCFIVVMMPGQNIPKLSLHVWYESYEPNCISRSSSKHPLWWWWYMANNDTFSIIILLKSISYSYIYHSTGIGYLLLHEFEAKPRTSVNHKDILRMYCDITGFYPTCFTWDPLLQSFTNTCFSTSNQCS